MVLRLLDLFCKAGGAGMGYARAGFEVVGVDIEMQVHYPFAFVQADALTFPLDGFDVIHASPPCQGYSSLNVVNQKEYPMLIPEVRARLIASGKPWIIENVVGAPMGYYVLLCGSQFGLGVWRHRRFETSEFVFSPGKCVHSYKPIGVYGETYWDSNKTGSFRSDRQVYRPGRATYEEARQAMGVDWLMTRKELANAIPPAYTEWIGQQYMSMLG